MTDGKIVKPWRRHRSAGLALLLLVLAASARAEPEARVASLRFDGVESIPSEELASQLFTRAPAWRGFKFWEPDPPFDAADLQEDLERVADIYREFGYYEARVRSDLEWNADRTKVWVRIVVHEGEPVRLVDLSVEFAEDTPLPEPARQALVASLPLVPGDIFGSRPYARARQALLEALAERGHPAATLAGGARVDLDRREAFVEWSLDPGPPVRFGEIHLTGLEQVDPELVYRELVIPVGAPYSLEAQRESERRLRDTELFNAVAIQSGPPERSDDEPAPEEEVWPLEIRLRERPPRSVRVGLGYGTEEQVRAKLAWRHRNFLGGARKLEVRGQYSSLLIGGQLRFLQPRFLDPEVELALEAGVAWETVPAYNAFRNQQRIQLSRPFAGPWKVRGGYRFEFADVTKVQADEPGDEGVSRVSALFAGLRRDTLDDRLEPTRGSWLDLYAEPAFQAIGSSASHATFVSEGRVFQQWWKLVFGGRVKLGSIQPLLTSSEDDVPITERFFSGGSTSVRGYDYQSIGPRDFREDPLGGLSLAEAGFEMRVPLPWRLSLVGFVDAGYVSRKPWTFRERDVQFGAGPGLRLATPVGPLRFDFGIPLNPRHGDDAYRIHFAVGHAF